MKKTIVLMFIWCVLGFTGDDVTKQITTNKVKAKTLSEWAHFLASDEMKGRMTGSPEIDKAADWIAERFKEHGLSPVPGQDGFFHDFEITARGRDYQGKNVIAYLPGGKRKDEYILLSAHYDHIGMNLSFEDDPILNGADDNAAGVVAMMAVSKVLAKLPKGSLDRSIVVAAWSAEEMGLLGSKKYAENPWLPLEKLMVNLNFELVGHSKMSGPGNMWMTGDGYSELRSVISPLIAKYDWTLIDNPFPTMDLFRRSDNASFAFLTFDDETKIATGIPAHSFSTWGGEDHYHRPHDEPGTMDYENMEGLVHMMTQVTAILANRDDVINWIKNDKITFSRPEGR